MKSSPCISYSYTSNPTTSIRPAMASRMAAPEVARGQDGFEIKGLFLLALCGFYALLMFVVAKLLSCLFSQLTAPVKSILFSTSVTEVTPVARKKSIGINNHVTELKHVSRVHTRSLCHG